MISANKIWVFFDPQYLLKGSISDFDFLVVEKYINEINKQTILVWSRPAPYMLLADQIWVFLDPQYLMNEYASDFHCLGVDSH